MVFLEKYDFFLVNPGSGAYNVVNHMIESNVKNYREQDPEILRKKPPFNIKQERFIPAQKESSSLKKLRKNMKKL